MSRCTSVVSAIASLVVLSLGCGGSTATHSPEQPTPRSAQVDETALSVQLSRTGSTLRISVRDNGAPVRTDLWLYTLANGKLEAFSAFKDPDSKRKSRRRMLPAAIAGQPSHLAPADTGEENGFMSDGVRDRRQDGKPVSAIDGDVTVELDQVPTAPLVVVAGVEDQRYAGAAGIDASGAPVTLPAGLGAPEKHVARGFDRDIKPLLEGCLDCHAENGEAASIKLVTYDDLVNYDLTLAEAGAASTESEYLVEPGAPALSPIARRTRPDEERGASAEGLKWFGKGGKRFGGHGDRRMPPQNTTPDTADDQNQPTHFDLHPQDFQILFDWIAQGANR
ncbi:MAG TPA: hypothetical protein VM513_32445 [Kofleriaceae bacterium]|nr:hypothetical protein [Kofleriaceae bacterium]